MNRYTPSLLVASALLVACAKDTAQNKTPAASISPSPQSAVAAQAWCKAGKDEKLTRLHFGSDGMIQAEAITFFSYAGEGAFYATPSIKSSDRYRWELKSNDEEKNQTNLNYGPVVEIAPFDLNSSSWKDVSSLPEKLRPKTSPALQINISVKSVELNEHSESSAFPCSVFASEVTSTPISQ